jgi:hypothetical protein
LVLSMSFDSGSVKPITSQYQAHPWEPTIDPSKDIEKAAAEDYTDVYGGTPKDGGSDSASATPEKSGKEPNLRMSYSDAPHLIPQAESKSSKGSTTMESGKFFISLSTLRTAEQTCLNATSQTIDGYNTLKNEVNKAISNDNLFGQRVGSEQEYETANAWTGSNKSHYFWQADPYDESSQQFADTVIPQMKNLLNGIGNAIEAMGGFNALLNDAGQAYATMDHNAAFPDG